MHEKQTNKINRYSKDSRQYSTLSTLNEIENKRFETLTRLDEIDIHVKREYFKLIQ